MKKAIILTTNRLKYNKQKPAKIIKQNVRNKGTKRACVSQRRKLKNVKLQNTNKKAKGSVVNKVNARKNTKKAIKKAQQIWQRKSSQV